MSTPAHRIRRRIAADGPIPFALLMTEALYGEGGYYRARESPIGTQGDFVTGSSLSPLFGRVTAGLVRRLDEVFGGPSDILEVGYGTGLHLQCVRSELGESSGHRIVALDRAARPLPEGIEVIESLDELSGMPFRGLVFSYELFDALPVHRLIGTGNGEVGELWVELGDDGGLRYTQGALSDPDLIKLLGPEGCELAPGQVADVAPEWGPLYRDLARILNQGLLVTCDYGFERSSLFDRRVRFHGTLACYRKQQVHRNALSNIGEQDLTAHVDFTTLIESGETVGLETIALTRQARWLAACGLFDQLREADQETRLQAMDLLSGEGMGEEIKVLVQGRKISPASVIDLEVLSS